MVDKTYTVSVQEDEEGNLILPFPEHLLQELGWTEDTVLYWHDNKDGSWSISDKKEPGNDQ